MKESIEFLLSQTKRKGMKALLKRMSDDGFYESPCSSGYHLAKEGGLAEHSLNVYNTIQAINYALGTGYSNDTLAIVALLHDLGKMGDFGKQNYVANMVNSKKKDENGEYIKEQSTAKPYKTNGELAYIPHEVRSIKIASQYINLTEEEEYAIFFHNGLFMKSGYDWKPNELSMLLHFSDLWCSRCVDNE